jgi:hypothetical protein
LVGVISTPYTKPSNALRLSWAEQERRVLAAQQRTWHYILKSGPEVFCNLKWDLPVV